MEATTPEPVCAKEALDLLNCVAAEPLDRDTCIRLFDALRTCVLHKMNGKGRTLQPADSFIMIANKPRKGDSFT